MNPWKIYREDGSLFREVWWDEEGNYHREDGPAFIWYHEDGVTISNEFWCEHGKSHRLDGPAYISYDKNGNIKNKSWYLEGKRLTKDQIRTIKRNLTINKLLDQ